MPELPEVEVICNFLYKKIRNKQINSVIVNNSHLRMPVTKEINNILKNKIIIDINRRSKYIICLINSDISLIIHLGMSGKLIYDEHSSYVQNRHDHIMFLFSDCTSMIFNDPRRFGLVIALSKQQAINFFNNLGIEPLTDEFNADYLQKLLKNKKMNIKSALMDSKLIVGIGNIYASESLFRARISPLRIAQDLNYQECEKLIDEIKNTLFDAISAGGSTLRDYAQPSGSIGCFQNSFYVYGKANKPCVLCHNIIRVIKQSGRSTYFCDKCQN